MATERTLLILGMHRSGTSACARLLNLCGGQLPRHLLPPNGANVTGYWEPASVVSLHDTLLAEAGSAWDDPTEFPAAWLASPAGQAYVERLADILRAETADGALAVVKDPRACRLVPLWRQALASLAREPLMLLIVRHPLEVAASLERRDGMPVSYGLLLWLEHVLAAEAFTRADRRVIITYERLLEDWRGTMGRIEAALGLALPNRGPDVDAAVTAFLDPNLRHERAADDALDASADVPDWVRRVYRWHQRASQAPDAMPTDDLDEVRRELRHAAASFAPLLRWFRQERARLMAEVSLHAPAAVDAREAAWQAQAAAWQAREGQLTRELADAVASRDEFQREAAARQAAIDEMQASTLWKVRRLLTRR